MKRMKWKWKEPKLPEEVNKLFFPFSTAKLIRCQKSIKVTFLWLVIKIRRIPLHRRCFCDKMKHLKIQPHFPQVKWMWKKKSQSENRRKSSFLAWINFFYCILWEMNGWNSIDRNNRSSFPSDKTVVELSLPWDYFKLKFFISLLSHWIL
jgi:hypothetical protein